MSLRVRITTYEGPLGDIYLIVVCNIENARCSDMACPLPKAHALWDMGHLLNTSTGFSSEIGTKLRESAIGQAGGSCYSLAALSSNDSKALY